MNGFRLEVHRKRCFKCGIEKPIEEFYRHPMMGDGHLGKCKDCTKRDMHHDRQTKPRVREYDRERGKLPHRKALQQRVGKAWSAKYPDRPAARRKARRAGLRPPASCQWCHVMAVRLEGHHHDYTKPLDVIWLCKPCHAKADKLRRAGEQQAS